MVANIQFVRQSNRIIQFLLPLRRLKNLKLEKD
jgi:hypothetical protein